MRRYSLFLLTLIAVAAIVPLRSQEATPAGQAAPTAKPVELQATPDAVVARLMSFDANHDGRVVRAELPERMQGLLTRGDVTKDGALDPTEVRRLAVSPAPQVAVRGLQPGHYGFGEDVFDSRLHIEGALEDLRLAANTRERAFEIGRKFAENVNAKAKADLLGTLEPILPAGAMADFRAVIEAPTRQVRMVQRGEPIVVNPVAIEPGAVQSLVNTKVALRLDGNLERRLDQYGLEPAQKRQALDAVEQFKSHKTLTDAERSALLSQLHGLLDDQQRDDLRAALERRPITKQENVFFGVAAKVQGAAPRNVEFQIQDLVLRQ